MPPKTASSKAKNESAKPAKEHRNTNGVGTNNKTKKRKASEQDAAPAKAQRRSARAESKPSQEQLLKFLLSQAAEDLARPDDEREDIEKRGAIKTYSSAVLNPYEELMCAVILSRPISHRLGLRTIRTVLNDPYNFTSAKAVKEAGSEKQHQALWDARTQHKDKTAQQLGGLAETVLDTFTSKDDTQGQRLGRALEEDDVDHIRQTLKSAIKGLGVTGLDIFFRRVQWLWDKVFPFIDARTVDSLRKFDLPYEAEELVQLIESNWKTLDTSHLAGDDEAQKKRRAFSIILERVIGADLEGKVNTVLSEAART